MTDQVHSITDAPLKHSVEQHSRMIRYTIAMSIRIVCFVLAAVVGAVWQSWWALTLVAAAVVLPYVAVVDANAGGDRYQAARQPVSPEAQPQLTTGHEDPVVDEQPQWWEAEDSADAADQQNSSTVISGELVQERSSGRQH